LPQPAEATRELSDFGPATTLPSFVEAAVVREFGDPGPIIAFSLPAEVEAVRITLRLPAEAAAVCELGTSSPATILPLPVEAAVVRGHGAPGPVTALPPPVKAAAVRGLGDLGTATILPPPVKTAAATHALGAAKNLLRAEAAPFNKAGSSLQPTGTKATAHPQTATGASLLPDGVVCASLGAHPGSCVYFFSPGGCNRGPVCWFKPTATQLRRAMRRKAGTPKHGSRREKKRQATREKEALSKSQRNHKAS
jgi:hypothetical protein